MGEPEGKDSRSHAVITNAWALRGAAQRCLKLGDQLADVRLKSEVAKFVHAMEHIAALLLGEPTRIRQQRSNEKEVMSRLGEEVVQINHLLEELDRLGAELGDREAKRLSFTASNRLRSFAAVLDRK